LHRWALSDKTLHRVAALLVPALVRLALYVVVGCVIAPLIAKYLGVRQVVHGSAVALRAITGLIATCCVVVFGLLAICAASLSKHIQRRSHRLGYLGCIALLWSTVCACVVRVLSSAQFSAWGGTRGGEPGVEAAQADRYLLQPVSCQHTAGDVRQVEVNITQMSDQDVGVGLAHLDELWAALDVVSGPLDAALASNTAPFAVAEI
jgi:hypothetical protein